MSAEVADQHEQRPAGPPPPMAAEVFGLKIPEKVMASGKVLRPYQAEAVYSVMKEAERARRRQVSGSGPRVPPCAVAQPTAAGKSVEFFRIAMEVFEAWGWRTLIISPSKQLVRQIRRNAALELGEGWTVGQAGAGVFEVEGRRLVSATAATLANRKKLDAILRERFELVIFDECHHTASKSWEKLFDALREAAQLVVGFTATSQRGDGKTVLSDRYFQRLVCYHSVGQLVEWGYLTKCFGYVVETHVDISCVRRTKSGDYNTEDLEREVNTEALNELAVAAWKKNAGGRKTIVFCVSIQHAKSMAEMFRRKGGTTAEAVWGTMKEAERERIFREFAEGKINVLTNCQVAVEGFDEPSVGCVLFCRPMTKALAAVFFPQGIGRAMRLYDGKNFSVIIEMVFGEPDEDDQQPGDDKERGRAEDILNAEAEGGQEGEAQEPKKPKVRSMLAEAVGADVGEFDNTGVLSLDEMEKIAREKQRERERAALREALVRLETAEQALANFNVIERLSHISSYAWVPLGEKTIHMTLGNGGDFIEVVQENPRRWAVYVSRGDDLKLVGWDETREDALRQADEWLDMQELNRYLMDRRQEWRTKGPTGAQIAKGERYGLKPSVLKGLTRGQVSDLLNSAQALEKKNLELFPQAPGEEVVYDI